MVIRKEIGCELIKLIALFPIGRDVESKKALAQTTVQLLKKCTRTKSFIELNSAIDFYGASIDIFSSPLYITAELYCTKKHVSSVLPLFFETLFEAEFLEEDLEILKHQNIDLISQNKLQTDVSSDKLLSETLFGRNHILGYYSEIEDYHEICLDDVKHYYATHISRCLPEFFIAGDVTSELEHKISHFVSHYSLKPTVRNLALSATLSIPSEPTIIDIPNASQSSIRLGSVFVHDSLEAFVQLDFLTFALGGYYTSELMDVLRQRKGYTYGVHSYLLLFEKNASLQIAFEADRAYEMKSLNEIKKVFSRLTKKGLNQDVVAKQYYSHWLRHSEGSLKELSYDIKFYKLGYDYTAFKQMVKRQKIELPSESFTQNILNYNHYVKAIAH